MKKFISYLLSVMIFMSLICVQVSAQNAESHEYKIYLNGKYVQFPSSKPLKDDANIIQVQADYLAKVLGANVQWLSTEKLIIIEKGLIKIVGRVDDNYFSVNNVKKNLGTKIFLNNNLLFMPVQALAESFGSSVKYDEKTKQVNITTINFPDVKTTDWFYAAAYQLAEAGIMGGYSNGKFGSVDNITVEQFLTITVRALGYLPEKGWKLDYKQKSKELGLWKDGEYKNFKGPIKRGEMARILVRAMKEEYPTNINSYAAQIADYSKIPAAYKELVLKAFVKGLMGGTGSAFKVNDLSTRAQAATVILKLLVPEQRTVPKLVTKETGYVVPTPTNLKTKIAGKIVTLEDKPYITAEDVLMVPFERIAKSLSWSVKKEGDNVTATKGKDVVKFVIGSRQVDINGKNVFLDTTTLKKSGVLYVSKDLFHENMKCTIDLFKESSTVVIYNYVSRKVMTYGSGLFETAPDKFETIYTQEALFDRYMASDMFEYNTYKANNGKIVTDKYMIIPKDKTFNIELNRCTEQQKQFQNPDIYFILKEQYFDLKTRRRMKELVQVAYPKSYKEIYSKSVKATKESLWENDESPLEGNPTAFNKYADGRRCDIRFERDNYVTSKILSLLVYEYGAKFGMQCDESTYGVHNNASWGVVSPFAAERIKKYELNKE